MSIRYSIYDGPEGPLLLALDDDGNLVRLHFAHGRDHAEGGWVRDDTALDGWRTQLDEYFAGDAHRVRPPAPPARHAVPARGVAAAARIPYGETISYGELAKRVDRPGAARAVGSANGQNPIAIIVPCHRVIGADGSLTGFGGGLPWKRWLLLGREQPQGLLIDR